MKCKILTKTKTEIETPNTQETLKARDRQVQLRDLAARRICHDTPSDQTDRMNRLRILRSTCNLTCRSTKSTILNEFGCKLDCWVNSKEELSEGY